MNLLPWRNTDADTKHDVLVMLVIHGVLYLTNLILYLMPAPIYFHHLLESEPLPTAIRSYLEISNHIRNYFVLVYLPLSLTLPWLDAFAYMMLRQRYGKPTSSTWIVAGVLISLIALGFFIYGSTAILKSP